jgi:hypothetical protein
MMDLRRPALIRGALAPELTKRRVEEVEVDAQRAASAAVFTAARGMRSESCGCAPAAATGDLESAHAKTLRR